MEISKNDESGEKTPSRRKRSTRQYTAEVLLVVDQEMTRRRGFRTAAQGRDYALSLANLVRLSFARFVREIESCKGN